MLYVIVCVVKGEAGALNNHLRYKVWEKFKLRYSKLPPHFTIKAPFEYDGELLELNQMLNNFVQKEKAQPFKIKGYHHFDNRVIYMDVKMSQAGQAMHDRLIDQMSEIPYIQFDQQDGKEKIFHVTVASKKLRPCYEMVWQYVTQSPCNFETLFDNICIYKWDGGTWKLYQAFTLSST